MFFRNDDVGELTPELINFVNILSEEGLPCSLAVVPLHLTDRCTAFLLREHRSQDARLTLHQHGYAHERICGYGIRRFDEFAGSSDFVRAVDVISTGQRLLRAALGTALNDSIFTPPCHKFTRPTLDALAELRFRTLSAGIQPSRSAQLFYAGLRPFRLLRARGRRISYHPSRLPNSPLVEISTSVEAEDNMGTRGVFSLEVLIHRFERARRVLPLVGVMFHHFHYRDREALRTLRQFIRYLKSDPRIQFARLDEIALGIRPDAQRGPQPSAEPRATDATESGASAEVIAL